LHPWQDLLPVRQLQSLVLGIGLRASQQLPELALLLRLVLLQLDLALAEHLGSKLARVRELIEQELGLGLLLVH
jgi:hypothetical protein